MLTHGYTKGIKDRNKQAFITWLSEKYQFHGGCRILELGCGNGEQWQNHIHQLPDGCMLVLSDLSEGMVKIVWDNYSGNKNLLALQSRKKRLDNKIASSLFGDSTADSESRFY